MSRNQSPSSTRRDLIKSAALVGAAGVAAPVAPVLAQMSAAANRQLNSNFRLYDPDNLPPSPGFSQVAEVARGKLVYIAGQVPRNAAGDLVGPGDFRAQLEQVFINLDSAVRSAGATFADVIKLNYYCVASIEPAQQRAVVEVRDRYVNTQLPPVSTFVFVSRLVHPGWLIEIEAVAVLPS
ncbi:RidA family protein [Steroidobacter cummioxidans]|uniref:RidA family protein n=1 Tax=Steroidobacter cummioxidans TaxID=1803913 RepID=UPI0019D4720F|nr:RidA family protein [Steroidobacter cummioxidans]